MSMPKFSGEHLCRESVINQILSSIAMEELALSHIINAEGEKLQYALGTLSEKGCSGRYRPEDLLELNKSIRDTLEIVTHSQMLLNSKLKAALEVKAQGCPTPALPIIYEPQENQIIRDTKPLASGTADSGNTVLVCADGVCVKTRADCGGKWNIRLPFALTPGRHTLTASQINDCGRSGAESAVCFIVKDKCCDECHRLTIC